jgi:hypothetical protein
MTTDYEISRDGSLPYHERRAASDRLRALADTRKFKHDLSAADVVDLVTAVPGVSYVSMNIGLHPGQATVVTLNARGEHAITGAVHVGLDDDGNVIVAVEHEPGTRVLLKPIVQHPRWRFYDYWRYDREKHDNFIGDPTTWPKEW